MTSVIIGVLLVAFLVAQKKPRPLDDSRIALVESHGNTHLFRGSNPFDDAGDFSYERLTQHLNSSLTKAGQNPLQDYYLIDVSLLDIDEYYTARKESSYFDANPQRGYFLNMSTISPNLLLTPFDSDLTEKYTNKYNAFVTELLNRIHELAQQQKNRRIVVYVHCNAGRDRTGFVMAGYRMLFDGMAMMDAVRMNIQEAGRSSSGFYDSAIQSYCRYLSKIRGKVGDAGACVRT